MELIIENCNNIKYGKISIKENSLNIKYAINGTGKSSIAKIIKAYFPKNDQEINKLKTYNSSTTPSLVGLTNTAKVSVFNEEYVNSYLFKKDDIVPNAFSVFVKTLDYEQRMNNILEMLSDIKVKFESNKEIDELILVLSDFILGFGKANSGFSKAGSLYKALGDGNKIDHIPDDLEVYAPYLKKNDASTNVKWLKWMYEGKPYISIKEQCPFCSTPGKTAETKTNRIYETYDSNKIEHLNKILEIFKKLDPYFSDDAQKEIHAIEQNINGISEASIEFLKGIKDEVTTLRDELLRVKKFNFFTLRDVGRLKEYLDNSKINLGKYPSLCSLQTQEKINIINESIANVESKVTDLQREIGIQKSRVLSTINEHKKKINDFLECAGYNYEVEIKFEDEENTKLWLIPREIENSVPINDVKDHLSYGERNAFALILFVYSALSDNTNLFVFDDPISSFDGNKRFAIINMLFLENTPLRNKTILLLSHDFSIVVDVIHSLAHKFVDIVHPTAHFLTNHKGRLKEKEIKKENIHTFCSIMKENAKKEINIVNRVIYLRRFFEVNDEKGCVWDVLSNAIHKRNKSDVCRRNFGTGDFEPIPEAEFNEALAIIGESIPTFDYDEFVSIVNDDEGMKMIYRNSESNYEKLQIYRMIKGEGSRLGDNVVQRFVNETFHVENNYIYQLDPREYETVPQYIVDICDKEIMGE